MKILEILFLILTFTCPMFFIIIGVKHTKKFKESKRFRNHLILCVLASFIINGSLYGGIKMLNKNSNELTDTREDSSQTHEANVSKTSKGYKVETIDGITYVDGFLIVNKTYSLREDYVPTGTHVKVNANQCQECIVEEAYKAYKKMRLDASNKDLKLWIASGYRSYTYQAGLYNMYVNKNGKDVADTFSARPGHSEHQSGYAFDLNTVNDSFANTEEGKWVADNCQKYGFILRYPKGKENETGYKYESWHLRYVGVELATKLYNNGDWITMEDYFGITSKYED